MLPRVSPFRIPAKLIELARRAGQSAELFALVDDTAHGPRILDLRVLTPNPAHQLNGPRWVSLGLTATAKSYGAARDKIMRQWSALSPQTQALVLRGARHAKDS